MSRARASNGGSIKEVIKPSTVPKTKPRRVSDHVRSHSASTDSLNRIRRMTADSTTPQPTTPPTLKTDYPVAASQTQVPYLSLPLRKSDGGLSDYINDKKNIKENQKTTNCIGKPEELFIQMLQNNKQLSEGHSWIHGKPGTAVTSITWPSQVAARERIMNLRRYYPDLTFYVQPLNHGQYRVAIDDTVSHRCALRPLSHLLSWLEQETGISWSVSYEKECSYCMSVKYWYLSSQADLALSQVQKTFPGLDANLHRSDAKVYLRFPLTARNREALNMSCVGAPLSSARSMGTSSGSEELNDLDDVEHLAVFSVGYDAAKETQKVMDNAMVMEQPRQRPPRAPKPTANVQTKEIRLQSWLNDVTPSSTMSDVDATTSLTSPPESPLTSSLYEYNQPAPDEVFPRKRPSLLDILAATDQMPISITSCSPTTRRSFCLPPQPTMPLYIITFLLIGSEGDVRPYVPFAKALSEKGHIVRFTTHERHKSLVTKNGLEFFPLGVDPKALLAFVVDHPDLYTLNPVEGTSMLKKMKKIYEMSWEACVAPPTRRSDIIIANPPLHFHTDIAERLGALLLLIFPFPFTFTPTEHIKHPFTYANRFHSLDPADSYRKMDQVFATVICGFGMMVEIDGVRQKIGLPPRADGLGNPAVFLKTPHLYTMSTHLVDRPPDWGPHIEIAPFFFLDDPPPGDSECVELKKFIQDTKDMNMPLVYFGYGSVPIPNPLRHAQTILEALKRSGCRGIIQSGWADITIDLSKEEQDIAFLLDRANHLWLFEQCDIVCHHGGIGTLATGLRVGKPTIVTPFFGDQYLWAEAVEHKIYGTQLKIEDFTSWSLSHKIKFCLQDVVKQRASAVGFAIRKEWSEQGVQPGVEFFYRNLPLDDTGNWVETVYEHQKCRGDSRVWSSKTKNVRHFSDETGLLFRRMAEEPPAGWEWTTEWLVVVNQQTDTVGWQYASRDDCITGSIYSYHAVENVPQDIRRRRQWVRTRKFISYALSDKIPPSPAYKHSKSSGKSNPDGRASPLF